MKFLQRQHAFVKFLIYLVIVFVGGSILTIILGLIFSRGDYFPDWIFSVAFITPFLVTMILEIVTEHGRLVTLRESAMAIKKDISIVQNRTENVLFQLENLMMTHMEHEKEMYIQKDYSYEKDKQAKGRQKKLRTMSEVRNSFSEYPELRTDEDVMQLFNKIAEYHNQLMQQKTSYNHAASQYNAGIQKMIARMFHKSWKMEKLDYYEEEMDVLVTEEQSEGREMQG